MQIEQQDDYHQCHSFQQRMGNRMQSLVHQFGTIHKRMYLRAFGQDLIVQLYNGNMDFFQHL